MPFCCDLSHEKWYSVLGGYFELGRKLCLMTNGQSCLQQGKSLSDFLLQKKTRAKIDRLHEGGHATNIWRVRGRGHIFLNADSTRMGLKSENWKFVSLNYFLIFISSDKADAESFLSELQLQKETNYAPTFSLFLFNNKGLLWFSPVKKNEQSLVSTSFPFILRADQWSVWPVIMQCPFPSIMHLAT